MYSFTKLQQKFSKILSRTIEMSAKDNTAAVNDLTLYPHLYALE